MRKNITKEMITKETLRLIKEGGVENFSLHTLSARLGIKTASLYSHISGKDELLSEVGAEILKDYKNRLEEALKAKTRGEALLSLGRAKREYAKENYNFYDFIMNTQIMGNEKLEKGAKIIVEPIEKALDGYDLSPSRKTDFERAFRAVTHGFISQEQKGYFSHFKENKDESYEFSMRIIINEIEAAENEKR